MGFVKIFNQENKILMEGENEAEIPVGEADQEIQEEDSEETKKSKKKVRKTHKKKSFSLEPCPHRAIKWVLVDRTAMNQKEYDSYLAKPKWLGKAWHREYKEVKRKTVRRMTYIYKDLEPEESFHAIELPDIDKFPKIELTKDFLDMLKLLIILSMLIGKATNTSWWKTIKWDKKKNIAENEPEIELSVTQHDEGEPIPTEISEPADSQPEA